MLLNEEDLILTLENLEAKNLISPDSEDDELYRFNHSKIREVVYDEIGGHRKRMMHEKAAVSLKELNKANEEAVIYQLAHHYSKTKDHNNSLKYSILAGEKASREFALNEAYDYYSLAQGVLDHIDDTNAKKEKMLEILVRLSDISYVIGEWDSALRYLDQLIKLSGDIGDKTTMYGGYHVIGDIYLSRSEWNLALDNLIGEDNGDYSKKAECQYSLGALYEKRGDYNEAIEHYKKSMREAVNVDDRSLIANAYLGIGRVYAQQGLYHKAIVHMEKSVEILEEYNDLNELTKAYINLGHANLCDNSFDKSISYYEKALKLAEKTGNIRMEGHGLSNLGESYIEKNDLEKAIKCLDKALYIFEKLDERYMISEVYRHYGSVYKIKEQWDRSIDYFNKSLKIVRELNMPYYVGSGLLEFGLMYKSKGDIEQAQKHLSEAKKIFKELDNQEMLKKIEKELETLNV
jgi:tetratricopeptide (TPR) repeat protein